MENKNLDLLLKTLELVGDVIEDVGEVDDLILLDDLEHLGFYINKIQRTISRVIGCDLHD